MSDFDMELYKQRIQDAILDRGVYVQHMDSAEGTFHYTVGRTLMQRPELLVAGLNNDHAEAVLERLATREIEPGPVEEAFDERPGFAIEIDPQQPAEPMFALAALLMTFGTSQPRALQVLWPDPAGCFPGDPAYVLTSQRVFS